MNCIHLTEVKISCSIWSKIFIAWSYCEAICLKRDEYFKVLLSGSRETESGRLGHFLSAQT